MQLARPEKLRHTRGLLERHSGAKHFSSAAHTKGLWFCALLSTLACGSPDESSPSDPVVDSYSGTPQSAGTDSSTDGSASAGSPATGAVPGSAVPGSGGSPSLGDEQNLAGGQPAAAGSHADDSAGQADANPSVDGAGAPDAAVGQEHAASSEEQAEAFDSENAGMDAAEVENGFQIDFEYAYDTVGAFDAPKRELLDESAQAWAKYIGSEFPNVPAGTPLRARHPEQIDMEGMIFELDYDIDDFVILVGTTAIDGQGGTLGSTSSSFTYTVMDEALLEELRVRYEGNPFQPWIAQTTFDAAENWFYDDSPDTDDDIPMDQNDFQTTAMHEIGHALGFGGSLAYEAFVVDGTFTGERAVEVYGAPVPLSSDLAHFARDTMIDGETPVMELGSRPGERKYPTALDLAVLEDIGYIIRWEQLP